MGCCIILLVCSIIVKNLVSTLDSNWQDFTNVSVVPLSRITNDLTPFEQPPSHIIIFVFVSSRLSRQLCHDPQLTYDYSKHYILHQYQIFFRQKTSAFFFEICSEPICKFFSFQFFSIRHQWNNSLLMRPNFQIISSYPTNTWFLKYRVPKPAFEMTLVLNDY